MGTRNPNPIGPAIAGFPIAVASGTVGAVMYSPSVPGGAAGDAAAFTSREQVDAEDGAPLQQVSARQRTFAEIVQFGPGVTGELLGKLRPQNKWMPQDGKSSAGPKVSSNSL